MESLNARNQMSLRWVVSDPSREVSDCPCGACDLHPLPQGHNTPISTPTVPITRGNLSQLIAERLQARLQRAVAEMKASSE
jgi:hypothetical protein